MNKLLGSYDDLMSMFPDRSKFPELVNERLLGGTRSAEVSRILELGSHLETIVAAMSPITRRDQ